MLVQLYHFSEVAEAQEYIIDILLIMRCGRINELIVCYYYSSKGEALQYNRRTSSTDADLRNLLRSLPVCWYYSSEGGGIYSDTLEIQH